MTNYFDYHTHILGNNPGAEWNVKKTMQAAIVKKLSAVCFTDRYPLPPQWNNPLCKKSSAMSMSDYDMYQKEIQTAVTQSPTATEFYRGAEVDWIPSCRDWTKKEIARRSFDYVIGSVHCIDMLPIDSTKALWEKGAKNMSGTETLIRSYYQLLRAMVQSQLFDGVGRLDAIKTFNANSELFSEHEPWYRTHIIQTLNIIRNSDMAIEINTSGWENPCHDAYPSLWIVHEAFARDIPITIGSDADTPKKVGNRLADAVDRAKQAGYRKLVRYKHRRQIEIRI